MSQDSLRQRAAELLETAGVQIGGHAPTDIRVHDEQLWRLTHAGWTVYRHALPSSNST